MPSAVTIFLKMADEKQLIYFTWPYIPTMAATPNRDSC